MGDILGLGITHQPTLTNRDIKPSSLRQTLVDPGLPEELRTPAGWPAAMREEWGDDEGAAAGRRHRDAIVEQLRNARKVLDEFNPDFVVIWGDDQYENFREDIIPPFCVLAYDSFECRPWADAARPNYWDEPPDTTFSIKGHQEGGRFLTTGLLTEGMDVSYAYKPLHEDLGHAFLNSVLYLDWDRKGFPYPVVPFQVNCYGRFVISTKGGLPGFAVTESDMDPPSPSPQRCFALGAACVRALADSPYRVALVASASWSHAFLTRKNNFIYPDTPADRRLYEALQQGDYDTWRNTSLQEVEDSGQHEMLNWFPLIGAMAELGRKPDSTTFVETHVMNSNKVIATFRP